MRYSEPRGSEYLTPGFSSLTPHARLHHGAHFLQADDKGWVKTADIGVWNSGEIVDGIMRYHDALSGLAGREGMRDDLTRYEALTNELAADATLGVGRIVSHVTLRPVRRFAGYPESLLARKSD